MAARRFPPPWAIEELDACLSATTADRHSPMYITGMSRGGERGCVKEGDIMKRTVCAFAVATLICAATYETSHAAPIAPLTGIQAGSDNNILVYSHHYRHSLPVIIVPPTRRYGYRPYWWPQGQYHRSPYGPERWGYWCEGAGAHRLSC